MKVCLDIYLCFMSMQYSCNLEKSPDPLDLELHIVMSCHVHVGNKT